MSESRTVPLSIKTDTISAADHGGIVVYDNNATNITVKLPGNANPMFCQISVLGSGTVTFVTDPGNNINGTVNGTFTPSQNVPYGVSCHINKKGVTAWFIK